MNIHIANQYVHHCNIEGLKLMIKYLGYNITDESKADVIYAPTLPINIDKKKKYIFGPHFSVIPNKLLDNLGGNNTVYVQPSQWVCDMWEKEFNVKHIRLAPLAFPFDTDKYNSDTKDKSEVIVYYKQRDINQLVEIDKLAKIYNIKYTLIKYGSYNENEYLALLKKTRYMIWLGRHESQGFALECALSCNVPILVWEVKTMHDEFNHDKEYDKYKLNATVIPYWDNRCGEYFYNTGELESTYNKFINNLDKYKPREYILDNLTVAKCSNNFSKLINSLSII